MIITNACNIQGRLNRIDVREGLSKAGAEFVSVTFTLDVDGNQIRYYNIWLIHTYILSQTKNTCKLI